MTRQELCDAVTVDLTRAHPGVTDAARIAARIVDGGQAQPGDGGSVVYTDAVRQYWPRLLSRAVATAADLETELAAVQGNDDRARCKRAAIRAAHAEKEIEG